MSRYNRRLSGSGGGSSSSSSAQTSSTTAPDTLRSQDTVEMVIGIGEGPIFGLRNGNKDLLMGTTAVQRADGTNNFTDFNVDLFPGQANAQPLTFALGGSSNNHQVGVALTPSTPVSRQTVSGAIDFVQIRVVVSSLYKNVIGGSQPGVFTDSYQFQLRYKPVDAASSDWAVWTDSTYLTAANNPYFSAFDQYQTTFNASNYSNQLAWAVAQQGGSRNNIITINGKTTSTYVKEYRIPVQRTQHGYLFELTQTSPVSDDPSSSANGTYHIHNVAWESYQEINSSPKAYNNTAILQIVGKATDQFSSIPQVSGIYRGLIVRVPSNYNALTKVYTGTWDGSWSYQWTNNPVWLLYEAISNTRWGWSAYTNVAWSQYEAYALAQICDAQIASPQGGTVPRYTFNSVISDPMDGREFCRYIAGTFNSIITDDNNGNVHVLMDKNDDAIALVGKESIIGDFEYTYTDVNTRFNDITVSFQNPDLNYSADARRVFNQASIDQFGRIPYDFVAVGCTNEWEAVRKATRRLVQANTETEMVSFKTNRLASTWSPYDIVLIADTDKAQGYSGRFQTVSGNSAVLRDPIYIEAGVGYQILIQDIGGQIYTRTLTNPVGVATTLTWSGAAIPNTVNQLAQFALSQQGGDYGVPKPYRILTVTNGAGPDDWNILALEINRNKFAAEDTAAFVNGVQYIFTSSINPLDPTNVKVTNTSALSVDGTFYSEFRVDFDASPDRYVTNYLVRYRLVGEQDWEVQEIFGSGAFIRTKYAGNYEVQVQSENVWEQYSNWVGASSNVTTTKTTAVSGGDIVSATGGFNIITVMVAYPSAADVRYAQIFTNTTNDNSTANFVGQTDSNYYVITGFSGVQSRYVWVKFVDNQGNVGPFTRISGVLATTTTALTVDLSDLVVTTNKIANNAVTGAKVLNKSLDAAQKLLDGSITGPQIAAGAIGLNYLDPSINPPILVHSLPNPSGYVGSALVFNDTDGKLYRYVSGAWTAAVPAADISGAIAAAQIASLDASKITTGTLATTLIPGLDASKIISGSISAARITSVTASAVSGQLALANIPVLDASKIGSGVIDTTKIAGGLSVPQVVFKANMNDGTLSSIVGGGLAYNTYDGVMYKNIDGGHLFTAWAPLAQPTAYLTGFVQAAQIQAGSITSTQIAAQGITAGNIVSGTITSVQIASRTIAASNIVAGAITTTEIAASTIVGGNIAAGTIVAGNIAAGAITASKILIQGGELSVDPLISDGSIWQTIASDGSYGGLLNENKLSAWYPEQGVPQFGTSSDVLLYDGYGINTSIRHHLYAYWDGSFAGAIKSLGKFNGVQPCVMTASVCNASTQTCYVQVDIYKTDGVTYSRTIQMAAASYTNVQTLSTQFTPTVEEGFFRWVIFNSAEGVFSGYMRVSALSMRQATTGALVVDGTITGTKLVAGTITATQIAGGTITADRLVAGTITGTYIAAQAVGTYQLAANSVVAGKISVASLDAISANLGSITVDNAHIGYLAVGASNIQTGAVSKSYSAYNTTTYYGDNTSTAPPSDPGGGVGSGGGGYGCVHVASYMPDGSRAIATQVGTTLTLLNETNDGITTGETTAVSIITQPCYRVHTESGITLICSTSTPIYTREGRLIKLLSCYDAEVPVLDSGEFRWEKIKRTDYLGELEVVKITVNDGVYAAGEEQDRYIFTHNKRALE